MNNGDVVSNFNFYNTLLYRVETFIGLYTSCIDYTEIAEIRDHLILVIFQNTIWRIPVHPIKQIYA